MRQLWPAAHHATTAPHHRNLQLHRLRVPALSDGAGKVNKETRTRATNLFQEQTVNSATLTALTGYVWDIKMG